jgi:hypothetical protein
VFGSGGLSRTPVEQGLFDEYRLGLVPVRAGKWQGAVWAKLEPVEALGIARVVFGVLDSSLRAALELMSVLLGSRPARNRLRLKTKGGQRFFVDIRSVPQRLSPF